MTANFQPILPEDTHKRTKNVHSYMQFYFIEKKTKKPLGVPKKDGTWHIIMDLSSPHGSSINDFIPKDDYMLHYASFDEALTLIACYGQKALMAKLDIKHAFRLCPVRLKDHELLGIHWQGKFYIDLCLPFSL